MRIGSSNDFAHAHVSRFNRFYTSIRAPTFVQLKVSCSAWSATDVYQKGLSDHAPVSASLAARSPGRGASRASRGGLRSRLSSLHTLLPSQRNFALMPFSA